MKRGAGTGTDGEGNEMHRDKGRSNIISYEKNTRRE
jgi:hypothetical protein